MPNLSDEDQVRLSSCMDEIRNVVVDTVSERQLVETIMKFDYDFEKSLDAILNNTTTPPSHRTTTSKTLTTSLSNRPMETGDTF